MKRDTKISRRNSYMALVLVATLTFLLLSSAFPMIRVKAAGPANWWDMAHIEYDGNMYTDGNPYDSNRTFEYNADCKSTITVHSDTTKGTLKAGTVGADGKCGYESSDIDIAGDHSTVGFYRLPNDVILAAAGMTCNIDSEITVDSVPVDIKPWYYIKWSEGSSTKPPDSLKDAYFRVKDDGSLDPNDYIKDKGDGWADIGVGNCRSFITELGVTVPNPHEFVVKTFQFKDGGNVVTTLPQYAPKTPKGVDIGDVKKPDGTSVGSTADNTAPESCESKNPNVILSWLLCSVIGAVDDTMSKMVDAVDGLLDIKQDEYNVAQYKAIWAYMKNIADFLLVGAALVIIIGQATRGE